MAAVAALLFCCAMPAAYADCANPARGNGTIIFNPATDQLQGCAGDVWKAMNAGPYRPVAAVFDGTNDWLESAYGGPASPTTVTASFWVSRIALSGASSDFVFHARTGAGWKFRIRFSTANELIVDGADAGGTQRTFIQTASNRITDDGWHHIMFTLDVANATNRHVYIDGVAAAGGITGQTLASLGMNNASDFWSVGAVDVSGVNKLDGALGDLWIDFGTYLDLSVPANRQKFIDTEGRPVWLGGTGNAPTGTSPDVFLSGTLASWPTNKGTGGGFTLVGALATTAPPVVGWSSYALTSAVRSSMGADLAGVSKWTPGAVGADGMVYHVPFTAADILIIDPATQTASRSKMGATISASGTKWSGGVLGPDGKIYAIPLDATEILIIDPATGTATTSTMGASLAGGDKWGGGVLGVDGKIYGIPYDSTDILIIDPLAGTATRSAMGATLADGNKWDWGVAGANGMIYGMPRDATDILIIDPVGGTASRSNMGAALAGTDKWKGGVLGTDGKIYGIPSEATDILIVDPVAGTATRSTMGATLGGSTKWANGVRGRDGKIYGIPYAATNILIIDPAAGTATRSSLGATLTGSSKWRGGTLANDGRIYSVPTAATDILILNPSQPCANPPADAGTLVYNDTHDVFQGCTMAGWKALYGANAGSGGGGCSNPGGTSGDIVYNSSYGIIQGCTDDGWVALHQGAPAAPDACAGSPAVGTVCGNGSVYAGLSPDGNVPMYTTPADAGQMAWNNNNNSWLSWTATGQSSTVTGEANTLALIGIDSDSVTPGTQPHLAAQYCNNLVAHGHNDWYVPARDELAVLYANSMDIGGFDTSGYPLGVYGTSTEDTVAPGSHYIGQYFDNGFVNDDLEKYEIAHIRCVRK